MRAATPFFKGIFLKKADGRLNLFEVDYNFYPALKHDCTKRFVNKIGTASSYASRTNLTLGWKRFFWFSGVSVKFSLPIYQLPILTNLFVQSCLRAG